MTMSGRTPTCPLGVSSVVKTGYLTSAPWARTSQPISYFLYSCSVDNIYLKLIKVLFVLYAAISFFPIQYVEVNRLD